MNKKQLLALIKEWECLLWKAEANKWEGTAIKCTEALSRLRAKLEGMKKSKVS